MTATGKVIGTVTAVVGEAKATAADGTIRILQVGDQVRSDEVISTSAAGSINVALENGKTLDCGGDVDLTLHEGILNVATAPSTNAPASDIDAIQRAIAAGQDPSQVATATAAGGAPAAGGDVEGGTHSPVILEQSNSASVVSSGFSTEGETIAFETPETESFLGTVLASNSAPVVIAEAATSAPQAPVFESISNAFQISTPADDHLIVAASAPTVPAVVEDNAPQVTVSNPQADANVPSQPEAPVTADAPVTVVVDSGPQDQPQDAQPPVVVTQPSEDAPVPADEPIVVAQPNEPTDEQPTSDEPIVVAQPNEPTNEQPTSDEPIVVTTNPETNDEGSSQPPVVIETANEDVPSDGGPSVDVPETTLPGTVSLTYSISANTNQDEQLGQLVFENGDNKFQTLVFFSQEGQQKPTAVALNFDLTEGTSTVKLQYIDAFAGNSDANTGHTAQKIAIKDFGLGIDGVQTVLAQESDGVNIGIGSHSVHSQGSVNVDMTTGQAGEWSFANPSESNGVDILDFTGASLNLVNIPDSTYESVEVINLKGSGAQELTLNASDVLNVTDGANVLHIIGGKEDSLNLDSSWTVQDGDSSAAGAQPSYFGWVQVNHDSGATLLVDPDVNIKGALMG